ncbi:unnamed protein product [Prorocentrum cordatum]|uniref:Uncharacterized protein n=1 Tax=Prorocentrum cordatum TaxID=2364126 RepID=A0ABN9QPI6_9DINO|nr:unnamed protein product [Polarella glacialis]
MVLLVHGLPGTGQAKTVAALIDVWMGCVLHPRRLGGRGADMPAKYLTDAHLSGRPNECGRFPNAAVRFANPDKVTSPEAREFTPTQRCSRTYGMAIGDIGVKALTRARKQDLAKARLVLATLEAAAELDSPDNPNLHITIRDEAPQFAKPLHAAEGASALERFHDSLGTAPQHNVLLSMCYRMHNSIRQWPSDAYCQGALLSRLANALAQRPSIFGISWAPADPVQLSPDTRLPSSAPGDSPDIGTHGFLSAKCGVQLGHEKAAELPLTLVEGAANMMEQPDDSAPYGTMLHVDPHPPEGKAYVPPTEPLPLLPQLERNVLTDALESPPAPGLAFVHFAVSRGSPQGAAVLAGRRRASLLYASSTRGAYCSVSGSLSVLGDAESRRRYWRTPGMWSLAFLQAGPAAAAAAPAPTASVSPPAPEEAPKPWEQQDYILLRLAVDEVSLSSVVDGPQRWEQRRVRRLGSGTDGPEWILAPPPPG